MVQGLMICYSTCVLAVLILKAMKSAIAVTSSVQGFVGFEKLSPQCQFETLVGGWQYLLLYTVHIDQKLQTYAARFWCIMGLKSVQSSRVHSHRSAAQQTNVMTLWICSSTKYCNKDPHIFLEMTKWRVTCFLLYLDIISVLQIQFLLLLFCLY